MTRKNKKFLAHTGDRGASEISCKTLKDFFFAFELFPAFM